MSCWVAPTIAAEFWRVPLEHVMDCIQRRAVPVRRESGFTFINIGPNSDNTKRPPDQRPATFTDQVTPEELQALQITDSDTIKDSENPYPISQNPAWKSTSRHRRAPAFS